MCLFMFLSMFRTATLHYNITCLILKTHKHPVYSKKHVPKYFLVSKPHRVVWPASCWSFSTCLNVQSHNRSFTKWHNILSRILSYGNVLPCKHAEDYTVKLEALKKETLPLGLICRSEIIDCFLKQLNPDNL